MPEKRSTRLAREAVKANPNVSTHALGRMLAKKYPADFDSAEVARDAVRYQRGAAGPTPRLKAHTTPPAEAR